MRRRHFGEQFGEHAHLHHARGRADAGELLGLVAELRESLVVLGEEREI